MYVLVLSLGDPVSRTFFDLLKEVPLVETRGEVEIRKYRDLPVVVHRGDSTEFDREDVLAGLGRYAVFISRHEMSNPKPIFYSPHAGDVARRVCLESPPRLCRL